MKILRITEDTYEVHTCGGLRRIVVTNARFVVRRTGRLGAFVQRLVGFVDATRTRFEATIRRLSTHEIRQLLPHVPLEMGIAERLIGRVARHLGRRQTLQILASLVDTPVLLTYHT